MNSKLSRSIFVLLCFALIGWAANAPAVAAAEEAPEAAQEAAAPLPLDELRTFAEIFTRIKTEYVEEVSDRELLENAIRGMLSGLDPHSTYLVEDEYDELKEGTTGQFGGLGIEVGMEDGFVKVISPIDDTPAKRAGIQSGDLIIRLDDRQVKGMTLGEAVDLMRGKPGTEIRLTVLREGEEKPLKIAIERDVIKVKSVRTRDLGDGLVYLRISHFQSRTGADVLAAMDQLKANTEGGIKGLVLDLRNNPGGILGAAVAVSDAFLTDGLVVYTKGRREDSVQEFRAAPEDVLNGAPMIVLVNEGSASASEIVAGALQDQKRALILGTLTFGKGSVQTILPVREKNALKLTTARYYTPSGRSIQAEGIEPDIRVEQVKVDRSGLAGKGAIKEADLAGHLDKGDAEDAKPTKKDADQTAEDADKTDQKPLIEEDFQLNEALNLLKGLALFKHRAPDA